MSEPSDSSIGEPSALDGLRRRFLLAAGILLGLTAAMIVGTMVVHQSRNEILTEVQRLSGVRAIAQQAVVSSVEAVSSDNALEENRARFGLFLAARALEVESRVTFAPRQATTRMLFSGTWRLDPLPSYPALNRRLMALAQAAGQAASVPNGAALEQSVRDIRGLLDTDFTHRIDRMVLGHREAMVRVHHLEWVLHMALLPFTAMTLWFVWQFLINPLRRRQLLVQRQLEVRETEAIELAARAEAASLAKSSFLATMSHEIRTPMNGVMGIAQTLKAEVTDPAHRRLVNSLADSGESLLQILNDILDFSKIEAGKLDLEMIDFKPDDLARKVEAIHFLRASDQSNTFRVRASGESMQPHRGDPMRILQILNNLVSNAIKFTRNGSVNVTIAARGDGTILLRVRDTGVGMTEEQAASVFQEFFQADDSISRRFGGTGLGMAIVNRLVSTMKGEIRVDSTPGRGTTVEVTLPLTLGEEVAEPEQEPRTSLTRWPNLKVLAADDVETNRFVLRMLLDRLGLEATFVSSGRGAISMATKTRFDVLLLDISMPDVDGLEALAAIRRVEREQGRKPSVAIAITANALTHQVTEYLGAGFDGHVAKPIILERLERELIRRLHESAGPDEDVA